MYSVFWLGMDIPWPYIACICIAHDVAATLRWLKVLLFRLFVLAGESESEVLDASAYSKGWHRVLVAGVLVVGLQQLLAYVLAAGGCPTAKAGVVCWLAYSNGWFMCWLLVVVLQQRLASCAVRHVKQWSYTGWNRSKICKCVLGYWWRKYL